jgi:hypothetical protein
MAKKYDIRRGPDDLWEVFEVATGTVVKTGGGISLSGLDLDEAQGALGVLLNEVIQPNGLPQRSSGTDEGS